MLSICGLVLGAGIAGCDPSDAGRHAAGLALTCDSEVAHVATLGSLEDPDGIRGNREIYVVPLSASGWVVLEPRETDVLRYDPNGRFEGILARRGQGPGELWRPVSLALGPEGLLWVADQQGRWVLFTEEGEYARTVPTEGILAFDGISSDGEAYKLYLAASMDGSGDIVSGSFFARRWTLDGRPLDPLGPGVDLLRGAPRVGGATSPHLLMHASDSTFLIVGNFDGWGPTSTFPGSPSIQTWAGHRAELVAGPEDLFAALGETVRARPPELLMRAVGPSGLPDRFWAFGALGAEGKPPGLESSPGGEGTFRNSPAIRNRMFDGVAWWVGRDGTVHRAVALPVVPDGIVGPDAFFSVDESGETGLRTVTVWRIEPCDDPSG